MPTAKSFNIFLAKTADERAEFEALRKQAFPAEQNMPRDPLDDFCDYLLIKDGNTLAGGCRLVRREHAAAVGGFYTESEFDITELLKAEPGPLEIGRFCTSTNYRRESNIFRLFWRHLTLYVREHRITALFGCASFPGVDPAAHNAEFVWLRENRLLKRGLVKTKKGCEYFLLDELPTTREENLNFPPLIKVYLNMGGRVAAPGFIDREFDCMDLCLMVQVTSVPKRYTKT